jgi:WD40 repeat protein
VKSIDPQLVLWDTSTGKQQWSITTELHELTSVAFSPDGAILASGHWFHDAALWDARSGALLRTLDGHTSTVTAVAFARGGLLASASQDGSIRLWDTATGQEIRKFSGHEGGVLTIAFEPDQRHLISGGLDRLVRRWDVESEGDAETVGKHAQAVDSVAISPTGLVATASSSRSIKIWSEHCKEKHIIEELKSNYWSIAVSTDSNVLAASIGYRIQRWGTAHSRPPETAFHKHTLPSSATDARRCSE